MSHFIAYWTPDSVAANEQRPLLGHVPSNQLHKVRIGSVLWVVTSEEPNDLVLVGRLRVDRILSQSQACAFLDDWNLWQAKYHAVCDEPQLKVNLDISRYARSLTFEGPTKRLPVGFTGQSFQALRRLDVSSANLHERLFARALLERAEET